MFGNPLDKIAAEWRGHLETVVRPYLDLPLLLSGGMDSGTILAAMLTMGAAPRCYTFQLQSTPSADLAVAERICDDFGLRLRVAVVPRQFERLVFDVRFILRVLGKVRKTSIQCIHPEMYMLRQLREDGKSRVIVGTGAICLDDRGVAILVHQEGEEAARAYRTEKLFDRFFDTSVRDRHRFARTLGIGFEEPLSDEPMRSFQLGLDYVELNRPKQKGIAIRAYPEFWNRSGYCRPNDPMQIGTGIRAWHDTLLRSPVNRRGCKSVVGIYNDMLKEVRGQQIALRSA